MPGTRVKLPPGVRPPFQVFRNGVPQSQESDYEVRGGAIVFAEPLMKEGRLGPWRWFLGAFGIGTYRNNDTIDVRYESPGGQMLVAHDLEFEAGPEAGR